MTSRNALDALLAGLALVILDFRYNGIDVLPDPLGYLLAALAAVALGRAGWPTAWTTVAAACFAAAALVSVPGMLAQEPVASGFFVRDAPDPLASLPDQTSNAAFAALLYALARHEPRLAGRALALSKVFLALLALGILLDAAWLAPGGGNVWPIALLLAAAGLVAFILALVVLWRARGLAPPPPPG